MSSLRLTQQIRQQMVLTPQLRQRIEMLQMTTLELAELIQQEMVSNPILEEVLTSDEISEIADKILDQNHDSSDETFTKNKDTDILAGSEFEEYENVSAEISEQNGNKDEFEFDADGDDNREERSDAFEEIDLGREFQDYLDPGYRTQELEYKEDAPSFEQFLSSSTSLNDHLEWQLRLCSISERIYEIGEFIIGNLNEDGRLLISNQEIAEMCGCSVESAEKARQVVMRLEPVGCGARDVKECLAVQLEVNGFGDSLAHDLVKNHLEDLQPHRLQHLAKATGIDLHELNEEINKIRILDPRPGRRYSNEEPIYVAPEVYIEKIEGEYVIYFTDDGSPRLRISPTYHQLVEKEETTKETKDFIKEKVRSAVDLLRNIEHRKQTIYRVVECIINASKNF